MVFRSTIEAEVQRATMLDPRGVESGLKKCQHFCGQASSGVMEKGVFWKEPEMSVKYRRQD